MQKQWPERLVNESTICIELRGVWSSPFGCTRGIGLRVVKFRVGSIAPARNTLKLRHEMARTAIDRLPGKRARQRPIQRLHLVDDWIARWQRDR